MMLGLMILGATGWHSAGWGSGSESGPPARHAKPVTAEEYRNIIQRFDGYDVILKPDQQEPEWWAGAPSVVRDARGVFWLACRMRDAVSPRGLRGYEIRILQSEDGVRFQTARRIPREAVPIPGFERPALVIDPRSGKFKLYACGPWQGGAWSIIKFDDVEDPARIDPASARVVMAPYDKSFPRDTPPEGYKDPFIFHAEGRYHAYLIGQLRGTERIYHFISEDGDQWQSAGRPYEPIMDLTGWHNFFVRPACVVPLGIGYLFLYEGSNVEWRDPVYNIGTGLGFTFDLHQIQDLTRDAPLLLS
ncbi:MAG TPA: hypothetical protein PLH79_18650, partial [bacterium]|nr:hypothetical protein [bacterium]